MYLKFKRISSAVSDYIKNRVYKSIRDSEAIHLSTVLCNLEHIRLLKFCI